MRLNDEHAYDDRVMNPTEISARLIPEFTFRKFIKTVAKLQGQITGFYWMIDFVTHFYPEEFPKPRVEALQRLSYKVFVAYHEEPPLHTLCILMKAQGVDPQLIAENLGILRANVYYYLKKEIKVPSQCMLTYGEYDLMLDFMDAWNAIKKMGDL